MEPYRRCPRSRSWKEERPASLLSLSWCDLYICISSIDFFCSIKLSWIYFCRNSQCKIPGCFFHGLENLKEYSGRNYKRNKDELIQKIYALLNRSVFDQKVESMNKHLLNTCCMPNSLGCTLSADVLTVYFLPLRSVSLDGEGRWDMHMWKKRNVLWVIVCGPDCSYHRRSAEGEITESLSSWEKDCLEELRLVLGLEGW